MTVPARPRRPWLLLAALVAAAALAARGVLDWSTGGGWPLLFIAVVLVLAAAARWFLFPE